MQSNFFEILQTMFPFWESLTPEDQRVICDHALERLYPKGKNVHNGNECTGVIFVKEGCLRIYMMSEEGKEITLYRLYPGDMCMLSASCVIEAITFDVFVDAEEDSQCVVVQGGAFSEVAERNPSVKIFALETAVSRFSDVMWVMQQILFMKMDKRLAVFLTDEAARTNSNTLNLTHEQIAKYMGSAREVVSRVLKYFVKEEILAVSRKDIQILNREKLRELTL